MLKCPGGPQMTHLTYWQILNLVGSYLLLQLKASQAGVYHRSRGAEYAVTRRYICIISIRVSSPSERLLPLSKRAKGRPQDQA